MKRLKRRRSSWITIIFFAVWIPCSVLWTFGWWKQSDESLVRGNNNEWHQVTDGEKTAKKILGLCFGVAFLAVLVTALKREFTSAYILEVEGEKFEAAYELSDDQIVEIGPLHGLNGNALALSLHYDCDWKPHLKTFKFYRFAPPNTYVSYHIQILNDQARTLYDKTFPHFEADGEGGGPAPYWEEKLLPVLKDSNFYSLLLRPIFDMESLERFDKNIANTRFTIHLQLKIVVCASPNQKAQATEVSLSQARATIHRVLDS